MPLPFLTLLKLARADDGEDLWDPPAARAGCTRGNALLLWAQSSHPALRCCFLHSEISCLCLNSLNALFSSTQGATGLGNLLPQQFFSCSQEISSLFFCFPFSFFPLHRSRGIPPSRAWFHGGLWWQQKNLSHATHTQQCQTLCGVLCQYFYNFSYSTFLLVLRYLEKNVCFK